MIYLPCELGERGLRCDQLQWASRRRDRRLFYFAYGRRQFNKGKYVTCSDQRKLEATQALGPTTVKI